MVENFIDLPPKLQECFRQKFKKEFSDIQSTTNVPNGLYLLNGQSVDAKNNLSVADYQLMLLSDLWQKAALHPEFGRIAAISWGGINNLETYSFKSNQISSADEKELLTLFADKLNKILRQQGVYPFSLCGFAAKGFNIPFLAKRMLINRMELPFIIDMENLKPWEQNHVIDLSAEWKMGSFESYTSLETLCALFDVNYSAQSPEALKKDFYGKNYAIVGDSCETKLISLATLYLRIKNINDKLTVQIK